MNLSQKALASMLIALSGTGSIHAQNTHFSGSSQSSLLAQPPNSTATLQSPVANTDDAADTEPMVPEKKPIKDQYKKKSPEVPVPYHMLEPCLGCGLG